MNAKCSTCDSTKNLTEVYVKDNVDDDEKQYICSVCLSRAEAQDEIGFCRCCGSDIAYSVADLDEKFLCSEHKGEFDYDEQETQDMEDYIENITKDG